MSLPFVQRFCVTPARLRNSSIDGSYSPMRLMTDFHHVIDARNKLIAVQHALGENASKLPALYEGYDQKICRSCPSWTRTRCKETSDIFGDRPAPAATERPE